MKIQFDSFNLVAGNDIIIGKPGIYEVECYCEGADDLVYEFATLSGGFAFEPDERGYIRGFEDADIVFSEHGFQSESYYGDIFRVSFKRELEELKLPSLASSFSLSRFFGILRCPELAVLEELYLSDIWHIQDMPKRLYVRHDAVITRCQSLEEIPADWCFRGRVGLRHNPRLKSVKVKYFESLDLEGCAALTSLPKGLKVQKNLDLTQCTALKRLPAKLRVGGDLILDGCTALKDIPPTIQVGGEVIRNY